MMIEIENQTRNQIGLASVFTGLYPWGEGRAGKLREDKCAEKAQGAHKSGKMLEEGLVCG